jgi:hypothetical protein
MAPGYYGQYIDAAERGGMAAVAGTEFFAQRIHDQPSNRQRLLAMDVRDFCAVMRRWAAAFAAPNPVGDLTAAQLQTITCPVVAFAGNTPDEVHHIWVGRNKGTQSCIAFWKTLSHQEVTKFLDLQHLPQRCRKWRSKGKRNGLIFLPL